MKVSKLFLFLLLVLLGLLPVLDLLIRPGHPVTFDGHIHMTTMNQFAQSLRDSEFPVTWSNNFANYGLPLPLFAHQLPAYSGALLLLLGFSTESAFIMLISLSVILTSLFSFIFFRKFANNSVSFTATVMTTLFPYKVLNIYTRGALPELMSTIFLPLLFLAVWNLNKNKYFLGSLLLFISVVCVALTHPMMLLIFSIPVLIYFLFSLNKKNWKKHICISLVSISLALLTASYYLLPLILEMKYFFQATVESGIVFDGFLSLQQLFSTRWLYTLTHPGPRANFVRLGFFEMSIIISAFFVLLFSEFAFIKKLLHKQSVQSLFPWIIMNVLVIILLLPISSNVYSLPFFSQIQYSWRFLNVAQFLIPGLFVMLVLAIPKLQNKYFLFILIAFLLWFRVPEFYGKNYIAQPESDYSFNQANLHSVNMNPVWTGNSEKYPVKEVQAAVIEGDGHLQFITTKNASRHYQLQANSDVRLIDYTFYFPGWNITANGNPVIIEYQDLDYRGLMTYKLPSGSYDILVAYKPTKVRLLGIYLTLLGAISSCVYFIYLKKIKL